MSYQIKLDSKSRRVARFISKLQKTIQANLSSAGMTQQEVAQKIGVNRSVVNRRLKSATNLTARSIAEFAYAFDKDVEIVFLDKKIDAGANWTYATDTDLAKKIQDGPITKGTIKASEKFHLESTPS